MSDVCILSKTLNLLSIRGIPVCVEILNGLVVSAG